VETHRYAGSVRGDYAERDAKNRQLGLAGEEAVLAFERNSLIAAGRQDLAERIVHTAKIEGDSAGYDIKSYTPEGEEKFIEVKTTRGDKCTAFYLSANEARFASEHAESFYLYRVCEFDPVRRSGTLFIHRGDIRESFDLLPVQFKVSPEFD